MKEFKFTINNKNFDSNSEVEDVIKELKNINEFTELMITLNNNKDIIKNTTIEGIKDPSFVFMAEKYIDCINECEETIVNTYKTSNFTKKYNKTKTIKSICTLPCFLHSSFNDFLEVISNT